VDQDVAGDVAGARQEAGVVPAGGLQAVGDAAHVAELPDLQSGADREFRTAVGQGQSHGGRERTVVGVEVLALVADHHELAGLVGRDQERRAHLPQQHTEVRRVGGPQRPRVLRLGDGRVRVAGLGARILHPTILLNRVHHRPIGSGLRGHAFSPRNFGSSLPCDGSNSGRPAES
jgi:hypothetical protein